MSYGMTFQTQAGVSSDFTSVARLVRTDVLNVVGNTETVSGGTIVYSNAPFGWDYQKDLAHVQPRRIYGTAETPPLCPSVIYESTRIKLEYPTLVADQQVKLANYLYVHWYIMGNA